jgi:conjugative relaxase-like TrwC/TraI family protein
VLSIAKMRAGAERYYLDTVATGLEEYYTGAGEAPGIWIGSGCADLDLSGEVLAEHLSAVLGGMSPADGSSLLMRRADPERRVAGFDLTFSAPKSVSLVYGLGSDAVSEQVRLAHGEAVAQALAYLEAHAARARRGYGGTSRLETSGLVAAAYQHRTSREGDPQLHTCSSPTWCMPLTATGRLSPPELATSRPAPAASSTRRCCVPSSESASGSGSGRS